MQIEWATLDIKCSLEMLCLFVDSFVRVVVSFPVYIMFLKTRIIFLTGLISASGQTNVASHNTGGGSGGSIIIDTTNLEGSGTIRVNGGNAYGNGGGGGGGRLAVYWKDREWWFGNLQAFGGSAAGNRNGGPGTLYMKVLIKGWKCIFSM